MGMSGEEEGGETESGEKSPLPDRDRRAAQVAHILSRAVRDEEMVAADALRILRHELRRRNKKGTQKIPIRSIEAQRVIDRYGTANVPKNESPDALHADHVYPLKEDELQRNHTLELWIDALPRLRTVVCVTAAENYRLEACEKRGVTGPNKYVQAGVAFTTEPSWAVGPLELRDVPATSAPWEQLAEFAEGFDGYSHFGENWEERVNAVRERYLAGGDLPDDLADLRGCLFCEFRMDRFVWGDDVVLSAPDADGVSHIVENPDFEGSATQKYRRAIVARIREILT
jgi:hypothetical protein